MEYGVKENTGISTCRSKTKFPERLTCRYSKCNGLECFQRANPCDREMHLEERIRVTQGALYWQPWHGLDHDDLALLQIHF